MAKGNRRNKPVDKKDTKKPQDSRSFWERAISPKDKENKKASDIEERNVDGGEQVAGQAQIDHDITTVRDEKKISVESEQETLDNVGRPIMLQETNHGPENDVDDSARDSKTDNGQDEQSQNSELLTMQQQTETKENKDGLSDSGAMEVRKEFLQGSISFDVDRNDKADYGPTDKRSKTDRNNVEMDKINFDLSKPVYVEIHKGNIFHYYTSGLLMPSSYVKNRAFTDIQTVNGNFLVLSNSSSHSSSDHILLEIDVLQIENQDITVFDNFALLAVPLPVTRIKKIIVQSNDLKSAILNDSLLFNGGFIPEDIIIVREVVIRQQFNFKSLEKKGSEDYQSKIDKYDRILGLLAFLRNYDLLTVDKSKVFRSLSQHFFYAMQVLDEGFGVEIVQKNTISEFYSYLFNENCPPDKSLLKWLFARVQIEENFTDADTLDFGKILKASGEDSPAVKRVLSLLVSNVERKKALKEVEESKQKSALPLYVFAFLRNYGNLNGIEVARRDIASVYSRSFGEYAFAVLGYFYGYKNLRNSEERLSSSNLALSMVKGKQPIKFQLSTRFDYVVIELVYRFVFESLVGITAETIRIREDIEDEKVGKKIPGENFPVFEKLLYGKLYSSISFVDPFEKFIEQISFLPQEIPFSSTFGTFCHKAKIKILPVSITELGDAAYFLDRVFFAKKDLLRYLYDNRDKIDMEEMQLRIQLEKKIVSR